MARASAKLNPESNNRGGKRRVELKRMEICRTLPNGKVVLENRTQTLNGSQYDRTHID